MDLLFLRHMGYAIFALSVTLFIGIWLFWKWQGSERGRRYYDASNDFQIHAHTGVVMSLIYAISLAAGAAVFFLI